MALAVFIGLGAPAISAGAGVTAEILVTVDSGKASVEGRVVSEERRSVLTQLSIARTGASGSVTTQQGSELELEPNTPGGTAKSTISFAPGDRLLTQFTVLEGGEVIARAERNMILESPDAQ